MLRVSLTDGPKPELDLRHVRDAHLPARLCVLSGKARAPTAAAQTQPKVSSSRRCAEKKNLRLRRSPHNLSGRELRRRLPIGGDWGNLNNICGNAPPAAQLTAFYIKYSGNAEEVDGTGENRMRREEERVMVPKNSQRGKRRPTATYGLVTSHLWVSRCCYYSNNDVSI